MAARRGPRPIGAYLLEMGALTDAQLRAALDVQKDLRAKGQTVLFGELLVTRGLVTPRQLETALDRRAVDVAATEDGPVSALLRSLRSLWR